VNDPQFHWWDEPNDLLRLQVDGPVAQAGTTITVDSPDPSIGSPGIVYGSGLNLKEGDLLMVELNASQTKEDSDIGNHEILRVIGTPTATTFTVDRAQAGTSAPAGADSIPDDAHLLLIGSAYEEGSPAASATSRNPIKFTNYCQIFKTSYEITKTALKTYARTGKVESNDKKRKVFDHSRQLELAMMFGQSAETTGTNGQRLRFMGGLREFIPQTNTNIFNANVTWQQYVAASESVFDFDTPAGDERILFCGNGYLNSLNNMAQTQGQVQLGAIVKQYGMELREIIMPTGRFYVKTHPLMNRHAAFKYSAFIIDASALRYRPLRDTKAEDNIQTPGDDRVMGQWLTETSLEVRYAGLTLGYHGNFVSAA